MTAGNCTRLASLYCFLANLAQNIGSKYVNDEGVTFHLKLVLPVY